MMKDPEFFPARLIGHSHTTMSERDGGSFGLPSGDGYE